MKTDAGSKDVAAQQPSSVELAPSQAFTPRTETTGMSVGAVPVGVTLMVSSLAVASTSWKTTSCPRERAAGEQIGPTPVPLQLVAPAVLPTATAVVPFRLSVCGAAHESLATGWAGCVTTRSSNAPVPPAESTWTK